MKLIFYDVDGVLIPYSRFQVPKSERPSNHTVTGWDTDCVRRLIEIRERTGALFVMSSCWRHKPGVVDEALDRWGIRPHGEMNGHGRFVGGVGVTGYIACDRHASCRAAEVTAYAEEAGCDDWIVIDDERGDLSPVHLPEERFVFVEGHEGLMQHHVDRAVALLGETMERTNS